ncbi:hypothetical protein [Rickettsiella endosymbiont of Dermanyssus gallinae]|uniref:hypothetical protein n=1 Tax=Rickettsiella endosymbiont of Dermanyssus gallinae TaxID=2856608 RepID=UPI001C52BEBC|nr:hypothetical protein [Rickettsiella endosymbiont of Dermanyssus gallinae]
MTKLSKSQKNPLTRVGFMLSQEKHRELKVIAAAKGLTVKEVLNKLIDDFLAKEKKKP